MMEAVVASDTHAYKLEVFNSIAFPLIKVNNSLIIINAVVRPKQICTYTTTKIMRIPPVTPSKAAVDEAETLRGLLLKVESPQKMVAEILTLKEGTFFSLVARVIEVKHCSSLSVHIFSVK